MKAVLQSYGMYHPLQAFYRSLVSFFFNQYYRAAYLKYRGPGFTCNFCGATYKKFVPAYPGRSVSKAIYENNVVAGPGENVFCPNCMSKNRERLVKDVIENYIDIGGKSVLHFSPEKKLYNYLKKKCVVTTADITPGFYKNIDRSIIYADATQLAFADERFDVVIANHILEHIPEDVKAMREIYRVLKRGGVAILQVPYSETLATTIEDPSIRDPQKQAELFGQSDHVRIYALNDYIARLATAGFYVKVLRAEALEKFRVHAIQENEVVVLGYK